MDGPQDALGLVGLLPTALLNGILSILAVKDVVSMSCTSKSMHVLCMEEPLWMVLCLRDCNGLLTVSKVLPTPPDLAST
jgi:hypothetical protein